MVEVTEPSSTETAARGRARVSRRRSASASGRRSAQRRDCWAGARVSRDIPRAKSGPLSVTCGVDLVRRHHSTGTRRAFGNGDTLGLFAAISGNSADRPYFFRVAPSVPRIRLQFLFFRGTGALRAVPSSRQPLPAYYRTGQRSRGHIQHIELITDTHMPLRTTEVLNNSRPRSTARRRDIKRSEARGGKHLRCKRGSLCASQGPQQ